MQLAPKERLADRVSRALSWFLLIASIAGFAATAYLYFRGPGLAAGLVVREPERVLPGVVVGKTYEVEFQIYNPTGQEKRVFGGPFLT